MTGKSPSDFGDWTALWGDAQQRYWQSWLDLTRQAAGPVPEPAANPWQQGFDLWARALGAAVRPESRDWISKLADVNKGYLTLGEQVWKLLSTGQNPPATPEAWWQALSQGLQQVQGQFGPAGGGQDPWAGFASLWGLPTDAWKRAAAACAALPGDMEKAFRGLGGDGDSPFGRLLSMPGIGYTREMQEQFQEFQQKWLDYGKAQQGFGRVLEQVTVKALDILGRKLQQSGGDATRLPASLRDFYNLWVDCGEEAFAEVANTAEFVEAQSALVNALMAVKRQEQSMADEVLAGLNLPTRRELDSAHRRMRDLQRQLRDLQESQAEAGVRELREEVVALQRAVESLRAHVEPSAAEKKPAGRTAKASS